MINPEGKINLHVKLQFKILLLKMICKTAEVLDLEIKKLESQTKCKLKQLFVYLISAAGRWKQCQWFRGKLFKKK